MRIKIKRLDGEKSELEVEAKDTVRELKEKFSAKIGIAIEQLRLVYQGAPLLDNLTLEQSKITDGQTVHIILQLNG